MKKLIFIILAIIVTSLFAVDKYTNREIIPIADQSIATKDTSWYSYYPDMYYLWQEKGERATYIKADDFGLEYPVNLQGVSSYFFESGYNFTYKIYDKDGSTLLWNSAEMTSISDFNDVLIETPIIMTDDFYISIVPDETGMPRQASSNITLSDHSYFGSSDEWLPFYDIDERHEWVVQVEMAQFEEIDIYPPIVRSLAGNENFMDIGANLILVAQDVNTVVSPVESEYTLDGGSTWTAFSMTQTKANYTFIGTILGQPDGTVGAVRFNLEDSLSNSQWSEEYLLSWSKNKLLMSESFEDPVFPPDGWTMQIIDTTGVGFSQYEYEDGLDGVRSGSYSAFHSDGTSTTFNDDWLITSLVSIPTTNSVTLSFWQFGYWLDYVSGGKHEIGVSTDLVSWDIIYTGHPPVGESGRGEVWEQVTLSLQVYAGQNVYIGFHYVGNYEDDWYIDDVELFYDDEGPAIESISANETLEPNIGAFVNNDMDIKLKISDRTGVGSITGHYTFDGGSTFTNLVFSRSKLKEEIWSGTISALSAETAGSINFTLIDNGGNLADSDQYDIYFVADNEVVQIDNFEYQSPIFVNDSIDISVTFSDESFIDSCKAFYSKDDWATGIEITMLASKYHSYTYAGTIPAETTETFGKVKFVITDAPNNTLTSNEYEVKWLEGSLIYFDDFDANHIPTDWDYSSSNWGYNTTSYYSPVRSISDSPGGDYYNNQTNMMYSRDFDFSTIMGATMYFWASIDLEESFDYFYIEASIDSGATWLELVKFTGNHPDWKYYSIDIGVLADQPNVKFVFKVVSDENVIAQGVDIDDIMIAGYAKDYSSPFISYAGPESLVIGISDHNFEVDLTDISNISEAKVVYSIDDGIEQTSYSIIGTGVSGTYTMTIPAALPGAKINYKIVVTDSSSFLNSRETDTYEVYSGIYLYYENGDQFVDFYDIIGNSQQATAYAIAKRITMGHMTEKGYYKADLVGVTIGNYISTDDPSDPLELHIWADAGGFPGEDIITPIKIKQGSTIADPYALTIVDLRSYSTELSGLEKDIFVGFTSSGEGTNILYEVAANHIDEPGYVQHGRSWLGNGNEMGISWVLDVADVYHISAITGEYTYVGIQSNPLGLTAHLHRNYPNPFNPETRIDFTISQTGNTKLFVYNSKGEIVSKLIDGELARGYHSVSFDGSRLVSGVYYYALVSGKDTFVNKMILLK